MESVLELEINVTRISGISSEYQSDHDLQLRSVKAMLILTDVLLLRIKNECVSVDIKKKSVQ